MDVINAYPYTLFIEVFPEFRRFPAARYGFYAKYVRKVFEGCFSAVIGTECEQETLALFTAHYLWVVCNQESGGTVKTVKGVNSSVTFNTLEPERFLSNLALSPYGQMLLEGANLDYLGAGDIMSSAC